MKEKNLDGFYIEQNMEQMIACDEDLERHYLHIISCYRDVEPVRKLAVICNDKNIYTDIWYGKGSKDKLYIIITSDRNKNQVVAKAPSLVDTINLFRDLTKIFGQKIFEIIVPMYIYKISPEDKEFYQFVIDILKDRELYDRLYNDSYDKEWNTLRKERTFVEIFFPTIKSAVVSAMVLTRAHCHSDLHSHRMNYDDSANFNKFLTDIKKVCNYEEENKTIIEKFGSKKYIKSCRCRFCNTRTEILQ